MTASLRAIMLGDCNNVLDVEGRPIGEIRASDTSRMACTTLYAMCPYAGSRRRSVRLLNVSALDQLARAWPQPLGILHASRQLHGVPLGETPALIDLCQICLTVLCLPAYLTYRAHPHPVAPHVAAAHKMCQGLFGLCKNLLLEKVGKGEDFREATADLSQLYHFAEQSGALLSRTGIEACAAPPSFIGQALRMLTEGRYPNDTEPLPPLPATEAEQTSLRAYSLAVTHMHVWVTVVAISLRASMDHVTQCATARSDRLDWLLTNLSDYPQTGFNDPTVSAVLDMPPEIRHQYARGAIAVCTDRHIGSGLHRLLDHASGRHHDNTPVISPAEYWTQHVRTTERDAVQIFDHLQQHVMHILEQPPLPACALVPAINHEFGRLPSHWLG
jgi:hypothetical protein